MRQTPGALVAGVGLLIAVAASASAQPAPGRERGQFILGVGSGYAATKSDCDNCDPSDEADPDAEGATYDNVGVVSLLALWRVGPKAVVGAEVQVETAREDARVLYVMGTMRFHPWTPRGFFITAGLGMVQVRSSQSRPDGSDGTGTYRGIGVEYGIGWELLKDKAISLAPYGSHYVSTLSSVTVGDVERVNVIGNVWVAGIRVFFN